MGTECRWTGTRHVLASDDGDVWVGSCREASHTCLGVALVSLDMALRVLASVVGGMRVCVCACILLGGSCGRSCRRSLSYVGGPVFCMTRAIGWADAGLPPALL